jgi:hypothetical protein
MGNRKKNLFESIKINELLKIIYIIWAMGLNSHIDNVKSN